MGTWAPIFATASSSSERLRRVACALLILLALVLSSGASAQPAVEEPPGADVPAIPPTLPSETPFEGRPVTSVRAHLEGPLWPKSPPIAAPVVGAPFTLQAARRELDRLLSGGGFASGVLEVSPNVAGVDVLFRLVPARGVRRIVIRGNLLGDDEVRRAAGLGEVRDVTATMISAAEAKIRAYYVGRGWPKARVSIGTVETDNPRVVILQVTIEPGAPLVVARRIFAGLPTWDEGARDAASAYDVEVGDRADQEALDNADRVVSNLLRARGFPNATVAHSVAPSGVAGSVVLTVDVAAGARVIPEFEGNLAFDREDLLTVLDLAREADRSPLRLASKIETAYRRRGYFDAKVAVELLGLPTDRRRTLRFRIREGHPVTVAARAYPCLSGAITQKRLDDEIDSFLDEIGGEGLGDASHTPIDATIGASGDVARGARPRPSGLPGAKVFVPEIYERALEHLKELYRAEGYMFVQVGEAGILRGACAKGSAPGPEGCKTTKAATLDEANLCRFDGDRLPLSFAPLDKKLACFADPDKGIECAPTMTVVLPINPGPRSYLWDIQFDGTHAVAPAVLGDTVSGILRMGDPLSLRDADAARLAILNYYRDEGYAFATVRVAFDYSPDRSRARLRFIVVEGEQVVIDKIFVEGEKLTLESLIRARLLISEGGVYRANLVRESQERLGRLGVFQSVSIGLVSPGVPAKRKSVVVNVVERLPMYFEPTIGFSTGEGFRGSVEFGHNNLFGYALGLTFRARASYQPFLGADCGADGTTCSSGGLYEPEVIRRWRQLDGTLERYPRRLSVALTAPHTPIFGSAARTTLELINVVDLRRDFVLDRYSPILSVTYQPWLPLTIVWSGLLEYNRLRVFDDQNVNAIADANPAVAALVRYPQGNTGLAATSVSVLFDFRDVRLAPTKGFYLSHKLEYVRSIRKPDPSELREGDPRPTYDFVRMVAGVGAYTRLEFLPKKPILAFELRGGGNFNVFSCLGVTDTATCDIYPDRLFYLGGVDSTRGFFIQQMLPQDSIDVLSSNAQANLSAAPCAEFPRDPAGDGLNANVGGLPTTTCGQDLGTIAARGGSVFINPRLELRVPAFSWGGFVLFVDAANSWRNRANFQPWRLRYTVGPGLSYDTAVGPVTFDLGFNLSRYEAFNEPQWVFNFSIGRY